MKTAAAELVFVPIPGMGHIISTIEVAKLLVQSDDRLSITVLIMKLPFDPKGSKYAETLISSTATTATDRIRFISLPSVELYANATPAKCLVSFVQGHKTHVREAVSKLITQSDSGLESPRRLAGFVLDMYCTELIDVANEFGVPSYIFFTSGAAFLGLMYHVQALHDNQKADPMELKDSGEELSPPTSGNLVPAKVLPSMLLDKEWAFEFLNFARRLRETKGVIANTFEELESHAVRSLSNGETPPVYPIGPVLNLKGEGHDVQSDEDNKYKEIMEWLDDQPPSSVAFLCFGSAGCFSKNQVEQIARALENSGHRFLWSLRRPPPKDKLEFPSDYENLKEVLSEEFLDRTAGIGKVIGWAPQVAVLAHPAIGGFVSHCGWNSILESLWFGVPIATWPMYAEQQFNAFQMVVELGLAVEITMDYRKDNAVEIVISGEEIEKGISCVMEQVGERRKRVKALSENARKSVMKNGSSYTSMGRFAEDVMHNVGEPMSWIFETKRDLGLS